METQTGTTSKLPDNVRSGPNATAVTAIIRWSIQTYEPDLCGEIVLGNGERMFLTNWTLSKTDRRAYSELKTGQKVLVNIWRDTTFTQADLIAIVD
jgi:hypothetical protein